MAGIADFLELLARNFGEDDTIAIGLNTKYVNEKSETPNPFARDFTEVFIKRKALPNYVKSMRKKGDLYLSFTPLNSKRRIKANAQDTYIIAQDIDGAKIPEDFPPSYWWETSPNKYQGVWVLDNLVTPMEQEEINRKLIAKYGFDPCGADIVHYYRIPLTFNNKYKSQFKVSDMHGEGTVYRKRDIMKHLKDVELKVFVANFEDEPIDEVYYDLENLLVEYELVDLFKQAGVVDRSEFCWSIEMAMIRGGASKEEVKFVLLNLPRKMAKFDFDTVDKEVHRVFAKFEQEKLEEEIEQTTIQAPAKLKTEKKKTKPVKKLKKEGKRVHKNLVIKAVDEIEDIDKSDFWLVEGLWQNNSVGVIGAPSKSFKSTFTLNMACSIASGKAFDGRAVKQGGVLIVQGENSLAMEKDKIHSITGRTDLPIYFVESYMTLDKIILLQDFIETYEIKLLIIDPMYLLFGNGDINKHQDIVTRLSYLTALRDNTGVSVMLVHHSRKLERGAKISTSDMYGSAFIEGWYESMVLLQRNGPQSSRLTTYFRNYKSGDKYTLLVNDKMKCKLIEDKDEEDEWSEAPIASLVQRKGD